jgi:hypothetical protein
MADGYFSARWWGLDAVSKLRLDLEWFYGISVTDRIITCIENLPCYEPEKIGMYVTHSPHCDTDRGVSAQKWVSYLNGDLLEIVARNVREITLESIRACSYVRYVIDAFRDGRDLRIPFESIWGHNMRKKLEKYVKKRRNRRNVGNQEIRFIDYLNVIKNAAADSYFLM